MADRIGVDFDNRPLQPIVIADADGFPHTFQIRSMLVATGHEMEALEITNDGQLGYCFRMLAESRPMSWNCFERCMRGCVARWRTATSNANKKKTGTATIALDSGIRVTVTPATATVATGSSFSNSMPLLPTTTLPMM